MRRRTRKNYKRTYLHIGGSKENRCIFVPLMSGDKFGGEGLGNQLFNYAAGLTIQEKINLPICIVGGKGNPHSNRDYREILNVNPVNGTSDILSRIKSAEDILPGERHVTNTWNTSKIKNSGSRNIKIPETLYQNYISVKPVIPKFKEILMRKEFYKDVYKPYKKSIKSNETAYMHVRRGDKVQKGHIMDYDYYTNGLKEFEKNPTIKTIYIFSNDKAWCDMHMDKWTQSVTKPLEYKDVPDELETLYMMILCEAGAILSSSTFGAWGAMLGADMNPNSTIIYIKKPAEYPNRTNPLQFPSRWVGI